MANEHTAKRRKTANHFMRTLPLVFAAAAHAPQEVARDVGGGLLADHDLYVQAGDIGARAHEAAVVCAHVPGEEQVARIGEAARVAVHFLVGAEDCARRPAHVVAEVRVVLGFVLELHVVGLCERERAVAELVDVACGNRAVLDGFDHLVAHAVVLEFLRRDSAVYDLLEQFAHVLVGGGGDVHGGIAARLDTALHVFLEQGEVIACEFLLVVARGDA